MVGDRRLFKGVIQDCVWEVGRVKVWSPGKHGEKDCRVEIDGIAPTHDEFLAIAYGLFRAEDRYDKPGQRGRGWIRDELDEIFFADDTSGVDGVIQRTIASKGTCTA